MEREIISSVAHTSKTLLPVAFMFGNHILNSRLEIYPPRMT